MAGRADVADLGVADRAHDEVAVDRRAALGADAVVRQLVLAQGDVQVLLLAVHQVAGRTQDDIGEQAHDGDHADDRPEPPGLGSTALCVADDINDGKDIEHHDAGDHEVEHHADLRRDDLIQKVGHSLWPFFGVETRYIIANPPAAGCTRRMSSVRQHKPHHE